MKLLWLDMETTGIEVKDGHYPLEIGCVVATDFTNPVDEYSAVLKWDGPTTYMRCNEWCQKQHTRSGLLDAIENGTALGTVEKELIEFVEKNFPNGEKAILAGNSIGALDRPFIQRWFPNLEKLLHYRMFDVTAWRLGFVELGIFPDVDKKETAHRVKSDLKDSLLEFTRYKNYLIDSKRPSPEVSI